jgi:hypothetical protein
MKNIKSDKKIDKKHWGGQNRACKLDSEPPLKVYFMKTKKDYVFYLLAGNSTKEKTFFEKSK